MAFLFSTDEKPYICSLCDFVTTESKTYLAHVRVYHPASSEDRPRSIPSPTSDRGIPGAYAKQKRPLLQVSPTAYRSAQSFSLDPNLTPVDLCVRGEGCRGITLDRKSLLSHKCSFCSHSTRYPEVLWMHQTVAHRISSSSSNLAPKWAVKSNFKASKDTSLASKRRTGPPPVLEGKECSPLPPVMRVQRTRPPTQSTEVLKKNKPSSHAALPSSSAPSSSFSGFRRSSTTSGSQGGRAPVRPSKSRSSGVRHAENQTHQSRIRSKMDAYPRAGSGSSSSSLERTAGSFSRSSTPSPSSCATSRLTDRYPMPQEGLGFMLSSKHGLAEYGRARASPHQPLSHSQGRSNVARPGAVSHSSAAGRLYGASSSTSLLSEPRGDVKQETIAEMPDVPADILGFLKNYSPHELAALYHRWGAANAMLDPTGEVFFFLID